MRYAGGTNKDCAVQWPRENNLQSQNVDLHLHKHFCCNMIGAEGRGAEDRRQEHKAACF